jgi:anti-sigma regulatory factor (Ser/Thr protein kinase)
VREARRFLAALGECPAAGGALPCVPELATNAVLHSRSGEPGGRFTVRAARRAGSVRVEVSDEGGPWGHGRDGDGQRGGGREARGREEHSGRGLLIVGELASRWGREDGADRRTMWFELDW